MEDSVGEPQAAPSSANIPDANDRNIDSKERADSHNHLSNSAADADYSYDPSSKAPSTKKFRFKSKSSRTRTSSSSRHKSRHSRERSRSPLLFRSTSPDTSDHNRHGHKKRRKHHHHSKPTEYFMSDDPSAYDDTSRPYHYATEDGFRESLFEAMADDEGAQFWEGVYGQPIHTYPRPSALDSMTDDDYAQYVRSQMYEKTHEYEYAVHKKREEAKKRRKEEETREREEWQRKEAARLTRRREKESQKRRDRFVERWKRYLADWDELMQGNKIHIPWPVESGRLKDADKDNIQIFFESAPSLKDVDEDFLVLLRRERIRWHPDKVLQRLGRERVDEATLKGVTAVFQVIDELWNARKATK